MSKEVLLIYQDCPYCHDNEKWGAKQEELARQNGITIRKIRYNFPGAKGLINKGKNNGAATLPFFTDGETFGYSIKLFIKPQTVKPKAAKADDIRLNITNGIKRRTKRKVVAKKDESNEANGQD